MKVCERENWYSNCSSDMLKLPLGFVFEWMVVFNTNLFFWIAILYIFMPSSVQYTWIILIKYWCKLPKTYFYFFLFCWFRLPQFYLFFNIITYYFNKVNNYSLSWNRTPLVSFFNIITYFFNKNKYINLFYFILFRADLYFYLFLIL